MWCPVPSSPRSSSKPSSPCCATRPLETSNAYVEASVPCAAHRSSMPMSGATYATTTGRISTPTTGIRPNWSNNGGPHCSGRKAASPIVSRAVAADPVTRRPPKPVELGRLSSLPARAIDQPHSFCPRSGCETLPRNAPDQCGQETPQCRPRRVAGPGRPAPAPPDAPVNVPSSAAVRKEACSDAFEFGPVEQRHHVQRRDVSLDFGVARCHVVTLGSSDGCLQQGGIARCVEEQLWVGKHICHSPLQWLAFGQRFVPGVVRLGGIRCPASASNGL